jgi:Reverse transcriptase (RNA-dependent DNA polymerase)
LDHTLSNSTNSLFSLLSADVCAEVDISQRYIDFTNDYDSIDQHALRGVLKPSNVHPKLISLLEDLHSGTLQLRWVGSRYDVTEGIRQGCVMAATLFDICMDHVVRKALDLMLEKHLD